MEKVDTRHIAEIEMSCNGIEKGEERSMQK